MPKPLKIRCHGCYSPPTAAARVERSDFKVYDWSSRTFKDPAAASKPLIPLAAAPQGSPFPNESEVVVDMTPAEFRDGRYTVTVYDVSGPAPKACFSENVDVVNGDVNAPTPTDVALRIAGITVGKSNLRDALDTIQKQVGALYEKLVKPGTP